MGRLLVPALQVLPRTTFERLRELPVPGEVLVAPGQRVRAQETVLRAELPGDLQILRVAERLGIEAFEVLKGLCVKEGERIAAGQVICEHSGFWGLFRNRFAAPESGVVEFISQGTGHVGLRLASRILEMNAYIDGVVKEVYPGKAVLIAGQGALVEGIFGVGGERQGPIRLLELAAADTVGAVAIPADCRGQILVGGTQPTSAALRRAAECGAVGLITGGWDDAVLREYIGFELGVAITGDEDVPLTVVATEGFGAIPIAERILQIARQFAGQGASLNGTTQVRAGAQRPELLIPQDQPAATSDLSEALELKVGASIRIIRFPYFGRRGEIMALPPEPRIIATGTATRVLAARLTDGEEVIVPRANVELL